MLASLKDRLAINNAYFKSLFYLGLCLMWVVVTLASAKLTGQLLPVYKLQVLLLIKAFVVAIVYLGRYQLFGEYRNTATRKWLVLAFFLLLLGKRLMGFNMLSGLFYIFLELLDCSLGSLCYGLIAEVIFALFDFWFKLQPVSVESYYHLWSKFWRDCFFLGLWLTIIIFLLYINLFNFYIINVVAYGYLLVTVLFLSGIALFAVLFSKLAALVNKEVNELDQKLAQLIDWKQSDGSESKTVQFNYLLQLRAYLQNFKIPYFSITTIISYLTFGLLILILPYCFGMVI